LRNFAISPSGSFSNSSKRDDKKLSPSNDSSAESRPTDASATDGSADWSTLAERSTEAVPSNREACTEAEAAEKEYPEEEADEEEGEDEEEDEEEEEEGEEEEDEEEDEVEEEEEEEEEKDDEEEEASEELLIPASLSLE
jgi:hypothetical protein